METPPQEQPLQEEVIPLCINCKVNPIDESSPSPLCLSCRQHFINFPIPHWVKGFGVGVMVLVLIGLIGFPRQISIGIQMKRADDAIAEKKYLTAERALNKILTSAPELKNAKLKMVVASYYTMDLHTLVNAIDGLKGISFENNAEFKMSRDLASEAQNFFPSDSLFQLMKQTPAPPDIQSQFRSYIIRHPDEVFGTSAYINQYYEKESPGWCDSMVYQMLNANPTYLNGIMAGIYVARMQHKYDTAINYCRQLLTMNAECVYAIAAEARIAMAMGNFPEGIGLAKKALVLDSTDGYSTATLVLGYHLNHQFDKRDQLMANKASDSAFSEYMIYVKEIMDGKTKFN